MTVRRPSVDDQAQVLAADEELAADGFNFALRRNGETSGEYLGRLDADSRGVDLPPGRVPSTMLLGTVADVVVGRVHVRHRLNEQLTLVGGHIGYGVRPAYRGRGYATALLAAGLDVLNALGVDRALVTCDDTNRASVATIERAGGVLEDVIDVHGIAKRRHWIEVSSRAAR